ncbi:MAG: treZ [Bryobacterales bacterium]|nr:treZ [Bryobacterales bacterium]
MIGTTTLHTGARPDNPHGTELRADGSVRFRVWAPGLRHVDLELLGEAEPLRMSDAGEGWYELVTTKARPGTRYRFALDNGLRVPDPASMYQPDDVHGPSEVIDQQAWQWQDSDWTGRPWTDAVIYELHVGTFTPEGTFRAAIQKLEHLAVLGITAIQIMPVADFPGGRNWGYDGVLPYAPDSSYGRPEDLKALVDAAHHHGLMVFLDVVYNHFGPDGNYLPVYAPQFFTSRHKTPWGDALNFDGPGSRAVRDFVIHNALYWVTHFHVDGLRFDAVHAIVDDSPTHILTELAHTLRSAVPEREIHLILENEENQASWLERNQGGQPKLYTAQWNDDVHHALHTAVTGEDAGYYQEYRGDTQKLGRALAEGFAFQGEMMKFRGANRGEPSTHLPPCAFVSFLHNHDQIGNRAFGDRPGASQKQERLRAACAAYLLAPQIPMLFMGEEWCSTSPFPFFCDFGPDLAEAVRQGRRQEFAHLPEFQDPARRERIPDPQALETFESGKLNWLEAEDPEHRSWLDWYQCILTQRRKELTPLLAGIRQAGTFVVLADGAAACNWQVHENGELVLAINLSDSDVAGFPSDQGQLIWQEGTVIAGGTLGPWSVRFWFRKYEG